jgi:Mor family transcriptional regulator
MRQAKLTKEQVLEIRSKVDKSHTELAKEYGMSRQQIDRIINGTRWTWI